MLYTLTRSDARNLGAHSLACKRAKGDKDGEREVGGVRGRDKDARMRRTRRVEEEKGYRRRGRRAGTAEGGKRTKRTRKGRNDKTAGT